MFLPYFSHPNLATNSHSYKTSNFSSPSQFSTHSHSHQHSSHSPNSNAKLRQDSSILQPPYQPVFFLLRLIISDNVCILCITAAACTGLVSRYCHCFFSKKRSSRPVGLLLSHGIAPSSFALLRKVPPMSSISDLSPQPSQYVSPPITIILIIILLFCFFIGFFSIYFCKCILDSIVQSWNLRRTPSGNIINFETPQVNLGLEPELIEIFPSFSYASVKDFRTEKYGLECAICLAEFNDEDMLRLLTVCYHVFHQECIDLWLGSHKTCPVCRRDLDLPKETLENKPVSCCVNGVETQENAIDSPSALISHAISIAIQENEDKERGDQRKESRVDMNGSASDGNAKKEGIMSGIMGRFSRSHSTGHSIVASKPGKEKEAAEAVTVDRYTLRLKENVKVKVVSRGHSSAESCVTFGDFSGPKNGDSSFAVSVKKV